MDETSGSTDVETGDVEETCVEVETLAVTVVGDFGVGEAGAVDVPGLDGVFVFILVGMEVDGLTGVLRFVGVKVGLGLFVFVGFIVGFAATLP